MISLIKDNIALMTTIKHNGKTMAAHRVLIVDDSKTAQIRLKNMLKRYDVDVDIAFSAEEALGYLSYQMPSVIFLDHHMEGMDGLEALKIIKANPNTAMIPVIMYTSQSGDVYVGQARALGALDILSKEVIKPSGVEQVLGRLSIFPHKTSALEKTKQSNDTILLKSVPDSRPRTATTKTSSANPQPEEVVQMRRQVARLFEIHISDVRNQIAEHSKFIIQQLSEEIKQLKDNSASAEAAATPTIAHKAEITPTKLVSNILLGLILIALLTISVQLFQSQTTLTSNLSQHRASTGSSNHQDKPLLSNVKTTQLLEQSGHNLPTVNQTQLLSALSWATSIDMSFPYGQTPLGKTQVAHIQELVDKLDSAGFRGLIQLTIHFGNFCVERTDTGEWATAKSNTFFSQCVFAQDIQPESSTDELLSMPFLQFEQNSVPIQSGNIGIIIDINEFKTPLSPYPMMNNFSLASQWNAIAATNNRISIELQAY